MRFIWPLLFLSLDNLFKAYAQNAFLDSVFLLFEKENLSPFDQMNRLNSISSDLIDAGIYDDAMACADKALSIAKAQKSHAGCYSAFLNKGNIYSDNGASEKAVEAYNQCLEISKTLNDSIKIASAYNNLGNVYFNEGKYNDAMTYFATSMDIRIKLGNKRDLIDSYTNIGNVHTMNGKYVDAVSCYLKLLDLSEEIKYPQGIIDAHNNMGVVALNQANLDQGLEHFKKSAEKSREINDRRGLANSTNNIGNIYFYLSDFKQAAPYYLESLEMRKQIHDKYGMADGYNNLGAVYEHMNQLENAFEYYNLAKNMQIEIKDQQGLTATYLNLGSFLGRMGQLEQAVDTIQKGIDLSRKLGLKEHIKEGYGILYDLYKHEQDYEQAMWALEQYNLMKDSLLNEETQKSIQDLIISYETEKKERENLQLARERDNQINANALLKKENQITGLNYKNEVNRRLLVEASNKLQQDSITALQEKQSIQERLLQQEQSIRQQELIIHEKEIFSRNLALWSLGIVLILGGVITWLLARIRNRRMDARFKETREKALRAQLKPHFVFNALASIQNMVHQKPEVAEKYLVKFSHFTQEVLDNSEKKKIPMMDELSMLSKYIDLHSLRLKYPIQYTFEIDPQIDPAEIFVPPAIFQPLAENAVNYNFTTKNGPGELLIRVRSEGQVLLCTVEDYCEGEPKSIEIQPARDKNRKSYGLAIVKERLDLWAKGKSSKGFLELIPQSHGMKVNLGIPL